MNDNKLRNFLVNGFQGLESRGDEDGEDRVTEEVVMEEPIESEPFVAHTVYDDEALKAIEAELSDIRALLEEIKAQPAAVQAEPVTPVASKAEMPDLTLYMTSREQVKTMNATVSKLEASSSNKTLIQAMEQISVMREDFFRLCQGIRERIDQMDAATVLSSFEAYGVDMENILTDAGVKIGAFEFDRLNTIHQRIVGVVPTDDTDKDGTIAERLSDGYKLGDRVLLKEKVTVYKFEQDAGVKAEAASAEGSKDKTVEDSETSSETVSETACDTTEDESKRGESEDTEEKE